MVETMVQTEPAATAHLDTFARDNLPPRELWPEIDLSGVPELAARARVNCGAELLDTRVAAGDGDRPALVFPGGRWSYAELLDHANRIAAVLRDDLGLVPGNRVLLRGPNNAWMAACWFAVLKAGGICVTTMPLLRTRELVTIGLKARVSHAITDHRLADDLDEAAKQVPTLRHVLRFGSGGADSLDALAATKSGAFENVDTAADDTALIAFTSGTTGQPKGTMHFHRDVLASCETFSRHVLRPEPDDLFCGSPPLAFTFGLGGLLMFPMHAGASTLLLEQAAPPQLIQGIQDFRATAVFTAPTAYRAMAGLAKDFDLSSLKKCVSAGETLPLATFEAWRDATGLRIIDGIGSTEMLHIFIGCSGDDIRPGSTGKPVPGYTATLLDEHGEPVTEPGALGRLAVKGPTGCRYLADPERQRTYVENGWNVTGDTYRVDEDGYFWYQARNDDMIISSGYNIAGPEVENALLEHPSVLECAVVGVPDLERGHVVKAFVVLREGVEGGDERVKELQEFVKRQIAPYKYPRRVEFVDALPRTQTGKLQRFRLREGEG